jgi:NADH-quinone oxidoreductase subunit A
MTSLSLVAYLALFATVGLLFLFVNLVVGKFLRPDAPNLEKLEVYECGEPTIGSSFVQFDLRFYVVALLFIIFDVEVAFFFPWATVFGKAAHLLDPALAIVAGNALSESAVVLFRELGIADPVATVPAEAALVRQTAAHLAWTAFSDICVFFAVLMVGFAYVWKRGDLDWVRAVGKERMQTAARPPLPSSDTGHREAALVA